MSDHGEAKLRKLPPAPAPDSYLETDGTRQPAEKGVVPVEDQAAREAADDFDELFDETQDPELSAAWNEIEELKDALRPFADAGRRFHAMENGTVPEALRFITPEELRVAWRAIEYIP